MNTDCADLREWDFERQKRCRKPARMADEVASLQDVVKSLREEIAKDNETITRLENEVEASREVDDTVVRCLCDMGRDYARVCIQRDNFERWFLAAAEQNEQLSAEVERLNAIVTGSRVVSEEEG